MRKIIQDKTRFFRALFNKPTKIVSFNKIDISLNKDSAESLYYKLQKIDSDIYDTSQALIQAQAVNLRSRFHAPKDFISNLQKKMVVSSAEYSISWYQKRLRTMTRERLQLQVQLDRLSGQMWPKRILRWLILAAMATTLMIGVTVFIMGMLTAIYMLPIWGILLLGLYMLKKGWQ